MVLVSGFAGYVVLAPAHPWGLLASQHRPRGLPVRPPRGLPQNRAGGRASRLQALRACFFNTGSAQYLSVWLTVWLNSILDTRKQNGLAP